MKTLETDIAIIGGGTAGLAAAVAAAELGAKVSIFEKASTTGGTGNMGMGAFGVESRLQKEKKMELTKEQAFKIFMEYTHWQVDARLVQAYVYKSGGTIDWLEKQGVEFAEPAAYFPGSKFTWHTVKVGPGGSGPQASAIMMRVLTDKAKQWGAKIYLQTPAKKILKKGNSVSGLMAEDQSGEEIQVNAKAVIVATGGFGDNPEWIKKYTGYEFGRDLFSFRIPGMAGEGLRMAWEAGAAQSEMRMELIFSMVPPFMGQGGTRLELAAFRQPNLMVNLSGERFMNEEVVGNTTYTGNAIARQKDRCGFMMFDSAAKRYYEKNGLNYNDIVKLDSLDANIKQAFDEGCDSIYVADSLEELAAKTGINPSGLKTTVAEYNQACDLGYDDIFEKSHKYLRSIKEPKFYAAKMVPSAYGSLGGIKINYKLEVLNKNFDVIPGFYGAGVDVNTIYGDSYIFIMPGNTMGFALNSGRMAGEHAAEYVKSMGK
jgi:fumarate reductase flavoprotein subunit